MCARALARVCVCAYVGLQATLDGLVGDGGLTVAVFEELADPEAPRGAKRKSLKSRFLSQVCL